MLLITRYSIKSECLAPWIKFIWHFKTENADIHYKLLPTDCIDIVLNLSNNMVYETGSHKIIAQPFHVNGLRSKHSYIHQNGEIRIWGISFYSYGLFPFINKSLKCIQDEIADLYNLSVPLAEKLKTAISHNTEHDTVKCIEKALCSELQNDKNYIYKANLIHDFIEADDNVLIKSFCMERKINIKTFERMVSHYTGYTPKTLRRIKRFQTASNQLLRQNPINLSGISYDNSFSDQAHFTKDFQRFSGAAPSAFLREKATVKENTKYSYY